MLITNMKTSTKTFLHFYSIQKRFVLPMSWFDVVDFVLSWNVTIKVAIIGHYTMDGGTWGIWNKKTQNRHLIVMLGKLLSICWRSCSTVVYYSTHIPKIKGSNPTMLASGDRNWQKVIFNWMPSLKFVKV